MRCAEDNFLERFVGHRPACAWMRSTEAREMYRIISASVRDMLDAYRHPTASWSSSVAMHTSEGFLIQLGRESYCRAISASPSASPSSAWSASMVTVTFFSTPVNSNGAA
jgi:hypothetical protein